MSNINLEIYLKHNKLSNDNNSYISFIKASLSNIADGRYFEEYYGGKLSRPFTFAVRYNKPKFEKNTITVESNKMYISFSTGDTRTGFILYSAFLKQRNKPFNLPLNNSMTVKSVTKNDTKLVKSNNALIKMISPLCLREHNKESNSDRYISVSNENFVEKSKDILVKQLIDAGFSKSISENIELIPINAKKTVAKHYGCFIECSIGEFMINADRVVINHFLQYGIGSRKSSGFGFAKVILEA